MYKSGTPRLKGGRRGVITNLICCFEHWNHLLIYFITNSYLLLACFCVGFLYILVQKLIFSILTHNPKKLCRKRVDPSTKGQKWLKLHPPKNIGHRQMIIYPLYDDFSGYNFTYGCPRAWYFCIRKYFSIFLNLTKLFIVKKWLKLAPSVPTVGVCGVWQISIYSCVGKNSGYFIFLHAVSIKRIVASYKYPYVAGFPL